MTKVKSKKAKAKPRTFERRKAHPAIMGCGGKGKPNKVIDGDRLMEYVGIGWIELRKATARDKRTYPRIVEDA
jgi:hypothetical protein